MIDDRIEGAYPTLEIGRDTGRYEMEKYCNDTLVRLNIDKDVLIKQTQEIQRLNAELDKHRWIPVEERFPDECEVLVYTEHGYVYTSVVGGSFWVAHIECRFKEDRITHWMPLPQPPKGEEE